MRKSTILILSVCAVLLVASSVFGTLAYLTSQETVVNTFTVGQVNIRLDEAVVNENGEPIGNERTDEGNKYHLIPGQTYVKDPTMTVVKGSEESYVRMLLTINCADAFDAIYAPDKADLTTIFNGYDADTWVYEAVTRENNTLTYEFRYKEIVGKSESDTVLDALFDSITVPNAFDGKDMESIADLKITVVGHAVQAAGFANEDAAWAAFNEQING